MAELNHLAVDKFIEAVQSGADEAASAFSRTFDHQIKIKPGVGGLLDQSLLGSKIAGKGLVLALYFGSLGIAVFIPSSSGLIPAWCDNPDATGKSKLATFAQEWGMNLVPEDFFPEDFKAAVVSDLQYSLKEANAGLDAGMLEMELLDAEGIPVPAYIAWPFDSPDRLLKSVEPDIVLPPPPKILGGEPAFIGEGSPDYDSYDGQVYEHDGSKRISLDDLPGYSRSVLKVRVPVAAVLARARKPIKSILELGVGSVIQFDKSCDEPLDVEIGQSVTIATAEAVKVGDKFGFRIHAILLPKERFRKVEVRREGEYRVKQAMPQIIGKAPIRSLGSEY